MGVAIAIDPFHAVYIYIYSIELKHLFHGPKCLSKHFIIILKCDDQEIWTDYIPLPQKMALWRLAKKGNKKKHPDFFGGCFQGMITSTTQL